MLSAERNKEILRGWICFRMSEKMTEVQEGELPSFYIKTAVKRKLNKLNGSAYTKRRQS